MAVNYIKDGVEYSATSNAAIPGGAKVISSSPGQYIGAGGTPLKAGDVVNTSPGGSYSVNGQKAFQDTPPNATYQPNSPTEVPGQAPASTVNTTQPSPSTAQIAPPNAGTPSGVLPYDQAAKNLQSSPLSANDKALVGENLKRAYNQGFQNVQGQQAPQSYAQGSAMVQGNLPQQVNQYQPLPEVQTEMDGLISTYTKAVADYLNPNNQRKSLVDEYNTLSSQLGIQNMKAELMNVNRIMDGTEDDIRSEITAAGGFATESQVQAMTIGRNKSLLKKAQFISDQLSGAREELGTLINLSAQDRQYAEAKMATGFSLMGNLISIQQTMQKATQDNYNNIINRQGYDGLLSSANNDPYAVKMIEKSLGLQSGGLQQLAAKDAQARVQAEQDAALDRQLKQASLANTYSQIAERNQNGSVMLDPFGKMVVKPKEAAALNKELVSNDSYKAIQKGKDSLNFLKSFEDTFAKTGATSAVFSPRQNSELKAKYNAAILNLKEFFNLGVLNGPDEAILQGVLPDPTNRSAFLTGASLGIYKPAASTQSGLENMKKMIETSLDDRFKSLSTQYGDYSSQSITSLNDLGRSYIEQKLILHPEGFDIEVNGTYGRVNPDGTVTPL